MKKTILLALAVLGACATSFAQTTRSAILHFNDGSSAEYDVASLDSITFSNPLNFDKTFNATNFMGIYYGGGQYVTELSDGPLNSDGLPTKVGQTVIRFYAIGTPAPDSRNAKIPAGRYTINSSAAQYTIFPGLQYLCAIVCTDIRNDTIFGSQTPLGNSTSVNVTYNSTGTVNIDFRGEVPDSATAEAPFSNIRVKYTGDQSYLNMDQSQPNGIDEDIVLAPDSLSGGYSAIKGGRDGDYGNYSLAFFNAPLDASGFVVGPGQMFNMELFTEYADSIDFDKLPGTYTVTTTDGSLTAGHWLAGYLYQYYSWYFPVGTYYTYYGEGGSDTNTYGWCTDGTLNVNVEGDNIHFDGSFTTDNGHTITLNYTAPKSGILMRGTTMAKPNAAPAYKKNVITPLIPRANIHNMANNLKLVKIQ